MARKLTPDVVREIQRLRARGLTREAIVAKVGVSAGSVHNALAMAKPRKRSRKKAPAAPSKRASKPAPPPTPEEFRAYLAGQLTELQADAERARASDDDIALGRAQRLATQTSAMLARLTRDAPRSENMVLVDRSKMQAAADAGFAKLAHYVEVEEEAKRKARTHGNAST